MAEQRESYRVWQMDLKSAVAQLNQIFNLIANRLDQLEGLRGIPTVYTDQVEYPGLSISGQFAAGADGQSASFQNVIYLDNQGLFLKDTDGSHYLILKPGSNLTENRTLTITTGDANRTITLSGSTELADWFNQSVKSNASPTFSAITLNNTGLHLLDTNASHDLIIAPGSDLTADRTLTLTTGDSARTITLSGNPTLDDWFDQAVKIASSPTFAAITLGNTGLHILDTNASHDLIIVPGSDLTADRNLTLTTGDAARTITLSGDPTLDDWFDQGVKTTSSPSFAGLPIVGGATDHTTIEADGTIEFNGAATVWNDANVGGMTLGGPSATLPDEVKFTDEAGGDTGIYSWGFAVGEKVTGAIEIPHSYKEGSDITFHVHWQGNDAPTDTDNVQWQLVYTVAQNGQTLDAATTITIETGYDTQYEWVTSAFAAITGTNFNMGDQFLFELSRIAASADEYAGDAVISTVGFHYEQDTVGSRQITTK